MNLTSEISIRTPEGITFSYRLAGPVTRCIAWIVDLLVIMVLAAAVNRLASIIKPVSEDWAGAFMAVSFFSINVGYGICMEWLWRGQTIGKKVLDLRVMDASGLRLVFFQVLIRNLLRVVDMLPVVYFLGGLFACFSRKAQRLGDLAADTVVVHGRKLLEPDLDQLMAGKFNSLRAHPHIAARLRNRVSPEEARIALVALVRRESFDADARVDLFHELAEHFKQIAPFPEETVELLPDEQYVRNVVDILFRVRGDAERAPQSAPQHAQVREPATR